MLTSAGIRTFFLDFFKGKQHHIVPSAPVVIKNDPTLLFTNAGMNQFKDYFLGNKKAPFARIADTQKCLRVSGKHNDLEEVGVDTYHHTFFEMLGNWSFGNAADTQAGYFKTEAIAWSWELLTEVYKIDKERLYVTFFEGDESEGLPKDEEALNEWKKWVAEDKILAGKKKDNFWEMGDTGPCGPCTEIHYDNRSDEERKAVDGKTLVNADHAQVIEIWNNVFIQYNRLKNGTLEALPAKHVDTGMGFERLVRVLQNKSSNYDTDIFSGTIEEIEKITNKKYNYSDSKEAVAFRVLADHIRAIAFTIADGQLPSNTGAGYVIRRILRRAVRYYYSYLNYKQPLLYQLLQVIAKQFEDVFSELMKQEEFVARVIKEEEEAFLRTLEKGLKKFEIHIEDADYIPEYYSKALGIEKEKIIENNTFLNGAKEKIISGDFAFELNDTYGFPVDLTELMAKEKGWTVDIEGFNQALQLQKQRSRAATAIDAEDWIVTDEKSSKFIGYDTLETLTNVSRYRKVKAKGKEQYQIVLEATPFYAESGGQVGDTGDLIFAPTETSNGTRLKVNDTKKENNLIIHFTDNLPDDISGKVTAHVNAVKRKATAAHHSATHLLHAALRTVLGTHVAQKGSLVNDEHLRFDFSHFAKVTSEEIKKIEALVNEKIRENIKVEIKEMSKEEAVALGAMALFGEKYGDVVRVVIMDLDYSVELCGGTHVNATGELGFFKITSESAVAAGVRRIEAVAAKAAEDYLNEQLNTLSAIRESLKNPKDIGKSIENINIENAQLRKRLESLEAKQLNVTVKELMNRQQLINGVCFIGSQVEAANADSLKKICFLLKPQLKKYLIILTANIDGKAAIAIMMDDVVAENSGLDASKIIKQQIAPLIKGGGGGQKTFATAGGQNVNNLSAVIEAVKALL